jgi:hypothetical protein
MGGNGEKIIDGYFSQIRMLTYDSYCGNSFSAGSVVAAQSDCSFACAGNPKEICGAGNRLSVYTKGTTSGTTPTPTPTPTPSQPAGPGPQKTGLPAGWVYSGCLQ